MFCESMVWRNANTRFVAVLVQAPKLAVVHCATVEFQLVGLPSRGVYRIWGFGATTAEHRTSGIASRFARRRFPGFGAKCRTIMASAYSNLSK